MLFLDSFDPIQLATMVMEMAERVVRIGISLPPETIAAGIFASIPIAFVIWYFWSFIIQYFWPRGESEHDPLKKN